MSGPDQGDEDKGFLARWSQRKQEAKQPEPKPDEPAPEAESPPAPVAEAEAVPEFDLSSLPKLEEMTGIDRYHRLSAARACPNICAMRRCENPGRWIPRSATTSIPRSNTPMTGTRRAACRAPARLGAGMDVARMVLQIMGDGTPAEPAAAAADPERSRRTIPRRSAEHRGSAGSRSRICRPRR